MLARYSRSLKIQRTHFFIGLVISLVFTLVVALFGFSFWIWQASIISSLLSFAGVPHTLFVLSSLNNGPTFEMPVNSNSIPFAAMAIVLVILLSSMLFLKFFRKIPSPIKTLVFVVSIVTASTLFWQTVVSPMPSSNVHWITLDWSCSGVIGLCLITLIFAPLLFTIRGPLWIKIFWLFLTLGFSLFWNLLRMSLVTATLYYFGGSVFLLLHYLTGAFIDFIYIVAFYSLAVSHLSKFEVDEVMKFNV